MLLVVGLNAQIEHPRASAATQLVQKVGLTTITVDYSRPAAKGRAIFGHLVPYGRIWRVGANESTKITVDTDIHIMDHLLPVGTYALYAFPERDRWEIAFHRNTSHWGDGRDQYDSNDDLFRIIVAPDSLPVHQENFLITFDSINHNGANLTMLWANTQITIPLTVDTHAAMLREIRKQLDENPTAQTYYEAARYLQEQHRQWDEALSYVEKALQLGGDTYFHYRVESLILAGMQRYEEAIAAAKRSLLLAEREGKDEFVRMNADNIALWEAHIEENGRRQKSREP